MALAGRINTAVTLNASQQSYDVKLLWKTTDRTALLSAKLKGLKRRFGCSQNRGLKRSHGWKSTNWCHSSLMTCFLFFSLSKPRAVEVTCYQPAKVMAVAPVSTPSIYNTVPGTAVCAFAFVCVCVLRHAERFSPPTHPYLSAAASAVILS